MNAEAAILEPRPVRQIPDHLILLTVAGFAASFVLFGLLVDGPVAVARGLMAIITSRDTLLTDYFGVGGIGAGCVNAGLLTLFACLVYYWTRAPMTGAAVACLFLVLGFGLFGKNLLNIWFIVFGVMLYARFRNEPFANHINTAFFGAALALAVGVMLVVLGAEVLYRLWRSRVHFHVHGHDGGTQHFHAHAHEGASQEHNPDRHEHGHGFPLRAMVVGMVHGMAGSAALILLSLEALRTPAWGLAYIALFGIGSIVGMAVLSVVIAIPMRLTSRHVGRAHKGLSALVGLGTMLLGCYVVFRSASGMV